MKIHFNSLKPDKEMSNRLDKERENKLQPERMALAFEALTDAGMNVNWINDTTLAFTFKGERVTYYAYSGWATGKSIKDGRGLNNLLKQLK